MAFNDFATTWPQYDARLAYSLGTLSDELAQKYGDSIWFLGAIGDQTHIDEGAKSDHNPVVKDPATGQGIVRAIDIGGPDSVLFEIRAHLYGMAGDPRLAGFGFLSGPDGQESNWPFGTGWNTPGDYGHLHVSVTQTQWPSVPSGYVAAIDSTAPWGFLNNTQPAGGGQQEEEDDMAEAPIPFFVSARDDQGNPATFIVPRDLAYKQRIDDGPTSDNLKSLSNEATPGGRLYVYTEGFTWTALQGIKDA